MNVYYEVHQLGSYRVHIVNYESSVMRVETIATEDFEALSRE